MQGLFDFLANYQIQSKHRKPYVEASCNVPIIKSSYPVSLCTRKITCDGTAEPEHLLFDRVGSDFARTGLVATTLVALAEYVRAYKLF
jgi:hypothetical protein